MYNFKKGKITYAKSQSITTITIAKISLYCILKQSQEVNYQMKRSTLLSST